MSKFAVILAAAGSGSRFQTGNQKKTYAIVRDKPVWQHSADKFATREEVIQLIIVVAAEDTDWFLQTYGSRLAAMNAEVVAGGEQRSDSVVNAMQKVSKEAAFVAIHDAARICISDGLIDRVFSTARQRGNAIPAVPVSSTIKRSTCGSMVESTVDRNNLFLSQTPQVFSKKLLEQAYSRVGDLSPTDEAQLLEQLGEPVFLAEGCPLNIKITTQQDLQFATAALAVLDKENAVPIQFDGRSEDTNIR
jgi:2-C-methyl-D-erythritol 4-phosphate cytidylyltransferase